MDVLVTRTEDIRWLTGFSGSTSRCLVQREKKRGFLFVDPRYLERARREVAQCGADIDVVCIASISEIVDRLKDLVDGALGVNPRHVTAAYMRELSSIFSVEDEQDHLDTLRRVKDVHEIAMMERAAHIADAALQSVVADGVVGKTEKQVRNQLEYFMRMSGADGVSFPTIVATGENGAMPHHEPSDAVIESGHGVVIDMGAEVGGYRSDMTRTVLVGKVSEEYRTMYELVKRAQQVGVDTVRAGVEGSQVDGAVRAVFADAQCEHEFTHGTGHGIGLYIHEVPILSPRCSEVLQAGEVVTVEPGLYRGGVGGVRIEDQVVVTDTGCRTLTLTPKELSCPQSPQMI
ncbi:MAG: hypothetical protein RIR69_544 [Actinomycetota bacterium]